MSGYIKLGDLELYKESVELSRESWKIYKNLSWQEKKVIGDQWITSIDSVGANIAEGYGRFHYKDRAKFYYNARGSLFEAKHWVLLLYERKIIDKKAFDYFINQLEKVNRILNIYINACGQDIKK